MLGVDSLLWECQRSTLNAELAAAGWERHSALLALSQRTVSAFKDSGSQSLVKSLSLLQFQCWDRHRGSWHQRCLCKLHSSLKSDVIFEKLNWEVSREMLFFMDRIYSEV